MTKTSSSRGKGKPIPKDSWVWQREMSGILDYLERPFDPGIGRTRTWWEGQVKYYLSRCDRMMCRVPRRIRGSMVYNTLQRRLEACRTQLRRYLDKE